MVGGQFVARQFVPGQFVACIADRNIIKEEREREKSIKRERSLAETKIILLKKRKEEKENTEQERKVILFTWTYSKPHLLSTHLDQHWDNHRRVV